MLGEWSLFTVFLYVIGIMLLFVEAFVPGFGVAGLGGVVLVVVSIILVSASFYEAVLILVATAAVVMLIIIGLYKLGFGKKYVKYLVLEAEQKNEQGYVSTHDNTKYLGRKGVVITPLRSAGTILIDDERIDAVSEGEFIEKDALVEVIKVEGTRVVVRKE